jgi:multidrug resistance efflux pump
MLTQTIDTRIAENAVKQMENRLAQLEQTVLRLTSLIPEASMPEACQKRTCSYFTQYLQAGSAELTHERYHEAEKAHLFHVTRCRWDWTRGACPTCISYEKEVRA